MSDNKERLELKKKLKRLSIFRTLYLFINLAILFVLIYFLYEFGPNPLVIVLILTFASLIIVGPVIGKQGKSYYSKLFPDKQEAKKRQRMQKEFIKTRTEPIIPEKKEIGPINLNVDYKGKKDLILRCPKCGMVLANFVKKCPKCKTSIEF